MRWHRAPRPAGPACHRALAAAAADRPVGEVARALFLSPGTVRNHLTAITAKLGVRTRADAHRLARDSGWT